MAITFRQLEIFVSAAQDRNFRRTAERLGIAQPSVSNHIRSLETHLGVNLFVRRRGVAPVLSFEGARFLEKAQELVLGRAHMAPRGVASRDTNAIQLTIMAGPLLLDACIRPRLTEFCTRHPALALQFTSLHPSRSAADLIDHGDIDLAIFSGESPRGAHLQLETIDSIGRSIYAAPSLARRAAQPGVRLDDLPWVLPPDDFAPARSMLRSLKEADVLPRHIVARPQFPDVIAHMALGGRGVAVLLDDFAAPMLEDGRLERIGPRLREASRVLLIGRRALHATCRPVVSLLRQALRTPLGSPPRQAGHSTAARLY